MLGQEMKDVPPLKLPNRFCVGNLGDSCIADHFSRVSVRRNPHKLKRRRRYAFVLGSVEWLSIHDLFPFSPLLAQKLFVNVLPLLDAVAFICTLEFIN